MSIAFPSLPSANAFSAVTSLQVATPLSEALDHSIRQELGSAHERRVQTLPSYLPLPTPRTEPPDRAAHQRSVQDLLGHFRELQQATRSEISQTRTAFEHRLDEMAAALHTDMRRVHNETRHETETLHKDLFHSATTLSHVQDRLSRLEAAFDTLLQKLSIQDAAIATAPPSQPETSRRVMLKPLAR